MRLIGSLKTKWPDFSMPANAPSSFTFRLMDLGPAFW